MGSAKFFGVRQVLQLDFGDPPLGSIGDRTRKDAGCVSSCLPSASCDFPALQQLVRKNADDRVALVRDLSHFFSQFSRILGGFFGACLPDASGNYDNSLIMAHLRVVHAAIASFSLDQVSGREVLFERALVHWHKLSVRELILVGAGLYSVSFSLFDLNYKKNNNSFYAFQQALFYHWLDFFYETLSRLHREGKRREFWLFLLEMPAPALACIFSMALFLLRHLHFKKDNRYANFLNDFYVFLFCLITEAVKSSVHHLFDDLIRSFLNGVSEDALKKKIDKVLARVAHECDCLIEDDDVRLSTFSIVVFYFFCYLPDSLRDLFFYSFPIQSFAKILFFLDDRFKYFLTDEDYFIKNFLSSFYRDNTQKISSYCDLDFWTDLLKSINTFHFADAVIAKKAFLTENLSALFQSLRALLPDNNSFFISDEFFNVLSAFFYHYRICVDFSLSVPEQESISSFFLALTHCSEAIRFSPSIGLPQIRLISFFFKAVDVSFLASEIGHEAADRTKIFRHRDLQAKARSILDSFLGDLTILHKEKEKSLITGCKKESALFWNDFDRIFESAYGPSSRDNYPKKLFRFLYIERMSSDQLSEIAGGINFSDLSLKKDFQSMRTVSSNVENFFFMVMTFSDDLANYDLDFDFIFFWKFFHDRILSISENIFRDSESFYLERERCFDENFSNLSRIFSDTESTPSVNLCGQLIHHCCNAVREIEEYAHSTGYAFSDALKEKIQSFRKHQFSISDGFLSACSLYGFIDLFCLARAENLDFLQNFFMAQIHLKEEIVFSETRTILKNTLIALDQEKDDDFLHFSTQVISSSKKSYALFRLIEKSISDQETKFSVFFYRFVVDCFSQEDRKFLQNACRNFYRHEVLVIRALMKKVYVDRREDDNSEEESLEKIHFIFSFLWRVFYQAFYHLNVIREEDVSDIKCTYNDVTEEHLRIFLDCFKFDLKKHIEAFLSLYHAKAHRKKRDIC